MISTDGFLYPDRVLEPRGLMDRKGFPESYDLPLLLRFLADIKSGRPGVSAPIHSHLTYDILPEQVQVVRQPDVVIVEGLNILEAGSPDPVEGQRVFLSDYLDFSIYVDAEEEYIREWYQERFWACEKWRFGTIPLTSTATRASPRRRPASSPGACGTG